MAFTDQERNLLLGIKGVGPKVIERLEQIGFSTFEDLAASNSAEITKWISEELGSTCWRNAPQARASIDSAILAAKAHLKKNR
ncbi:MAG: helix-hairpin-helix domain-containing protein [Chthoniobacterales bacterium]